MGSDNHPPRAGADYTIRPAAFGAASGELTPRVTVGTPPTNPISAPTPAIDTEGAWILVLIRDDAGRARLETAMRSRARVVAVESTRAAEQALAAARSRPTAAVLSVTDAEGRNCLPLVRTLTQLRPAVPVIGYCTAEGAESRDVMTLVRAGVHDVMFRGINDHGRAVRRFVETAAAACGVDEILRAITPGLHEAVVPFVRYCLEHPQVRSVAAVADAMGVHRKTLFVHCRSACAPPPGIIMTWCRLLLAVHLLAKSMRTVEAVAVDLGFASATALRNVMKRYTGLRPTAFRDGTAMPWVTRAFLAAASGAPTLRRSSGAKPNE
jgi:AraC-like DNA-binding protein